MRNHIENQIELIKIVTAEHFGLTIEELDSKDRYAPKPDARFIAMYYAHKYFIQKTTLRVIGNQIGGKDHATVLHAIKKVNDLVTSDRDFRNSFNTIGERLSNIIIVELPEPEPDKTYPIKAQIEMTSETDGEISVRNIIFDGSKNKLTELVNGVASSQMSGEKALNKFKQLVNNITL